MTPGSARRWRIVNLLTRLPRTCIAELIGWAQEDNAKDRRERYPLRKAIGTASCRQAMADVGACYCGKYWDEQRIKARAAAHLANFPQCVSTDPWDETHPAA